MLELRKICKSYQTGSFRQQALKEVTLSFRKNEFVAILGPSGSGKTTLLNIVGGLDRYDSGDLIINQKSTKEFKEKDWDFYRNNCIGFVFQNYNLISHITVLENVELGMTLSGVSKKQKRKKAYEVLERVGLKKHAHKKPNQLSGGQMQRVAIARALANDPAVILADEPTGALDTKTSEQIMDLIQSIAKDKLVIMVTHNQELADKYASRVVKMKDGVLEEDSHPVTEQEENGFLQIRKTAMHFTTALNLSFNNIKTKKGRTALTAFASSIGIIGIALILSLSNGFQIKIDEFERDTLSNAPIIISENTMNMNTESLKDATFGNSKLKEYPDEKKAFVQKNIMSEITHQNVLTEEYLSYLKKLDKDAVAGVAYQKTTHFTIVNHSSDGTYHEVANQNRMNSWTLLPSKLGSQEEKGVIENNYDVLAGTIDESKPGLILQVDSRNQIYESVLETLGLKEESVSFDDILKQELKVVFNDEYYKERNGHFIPNDDLESLYNNENSVSIKVQAIIRGKEDKKALTTGSGFAYTNALTELVISRNKESKIVKAQQEVNYNILTGTLFEEGENSTNTKDAMLGYLGAESTPVVIYLYPKDFESKDKITSYLDAYNKGRVEEKRIEYTDMAATISSLTTNIMDAITVVLLAFSSISLVVSSIMIGIITYISVLERTKEIGILRALGARKKDIKRVFNAETFIIGIFSGSLGIAITYLLIIPTNILIEQLSSLPNVANLNVLHALLLILISVILTVIGGAIPAYIASKKDPVESLRTE